MAAEMTSATSLKGQSRWGKVQAVANASKTLRRMKDTGLESIYKAENMQRPVPDAPTRCPVFGEIQWPGEMKSTRYCIIGNKGGADKLDLFLEKVANNPDVWNLEAPKLILSIMGGAAGFHIDPEVKNKFCEGLARVAKQTGAWIVTGGTASGVMEIVGEAMAMHDRKRTVPLIGVTSFGSLKSKWRKILDDDEKDGKERQLRIVNAPPKADDDHDAADAKLADLQGDHVFSILCDSGERGPAGFGKEADFRADFEQVAAKKFKPDLPPETEFQRAPSTDSKTLRRRTSTYLPAVFNRGDSKRLSLDSISEAKPRSLTEGSQGVEEADESQESLRVMLVLNGGPITFESVEITLNHECPVVVCRTTGRAADFLWGLKERSKDDFDHVMEAYLKSWDDHVAAGTEDKFWSDVATEETNKEMLAKMEAIWKKDMTAPADVKLWQDKAYKPVYLKMLWKIVTHPNLVFFSADDRLEDVVIGAALNSIGKSKTVDTAQMKHAMDFAVRWQCLRECREILSRLINLTRQPDEGHQPEKDDEKKGEERENFKMWLLEKLTTKEWIEAEGSSHLVQLIYRDFPQVFRYWERVPKLLWAGINPDLLGCKDTLESGAMQAYDYPEYGQSICFLYLVEKGASNSVVDSMWLQTDFPAHAALAAAHCYRECAKRNKVQSRSFEQAGDRYEEIAIKLLNLVPDPTKLLFLPAPNWGGWTLLKLAHHLECKNFIMEPNCAQAVDLLWFSPSPLKIFEDTPEAGKRINPKTVEGASAITILASICARKYRFGNIDFEPQEFWSIPKIKCLTHCLSRVVFIALYSWFALYDSHSRDYFVLEAILISYGIAFGAIEVLQYTRAGSLDDYFQSFWNILDVFLISLLLVVFIFEVTLVPMGFMTYFDTRFLHAFNLLPCYARLLQMLELTEMLGTLFLTFFDMYKDTFNFMVLLIIVGFGFSCALTPMLLVDPQTRWDHGFRHLFWTFWAIFGENGEAPDTEKLSQYTSFSFVVQPLRYFLYLTLNVLLVNLLIAQMNDSYTANKEESKRNWSFQCLEAVLEYASDEVHSLPPPFDLHVSLMNIRKAWNENASQTTTSSNGSPSLEGDAGTASTDSSKIATRMTKDVMTLQSRKEKQSLKALQHKVINEESGESSKKDQDTDAQESMLERQLKLAIDNSKLGAMQDDLKKVMEFMNLHEKVLQLEKENASLKAENRSLKGLYATLGKKAERLISFIKKEKGDSATELLEDLPSNMVDATLDDDNGSSSANMNAS